MRRGWWVALALWLGAAAAATAAGPDLQIAVTVEREVRSATPGGQVRVVRQPVTETRPGDVLVYTLQYHNAGDAPAVRAVIAEPVPAGTVLLRGSTVVQGGSVEFSTDGKSWSGWPRVQRATLGGQPEEVDAPPAAVRSVRFVLQDAIPVGGVGSASFKVAVQ